ncbi:predicted protein [Botrytis cinerea T4]|uniref:Uncharacterized protein n=1 Tax=Botryotinia fuckeliana (strain T4) TaxID=999810 RepID=G2YXQ4_BOTF4|nr:predicted protein [Botrytis cinerea T4]
MMPLIINALESLDQNLSEPAVNMMEASTSEKSRESHCSMCKSHRNFRQVSASQSS